MKVTVLLFASLAEKSGRRKVELPACEGDTVRDVREQLFNKFPALRGFEASLMYAVNEEYAREDTRVPAGATVALIPPVSGG